MSSSQSVYVEERIGKVWDKCLIDSTVKLGGGLVLGTVFTILFFQRKRWPIVAGAGFGLGLAYANCERELNNILKR